MAAMLFNGGVPILTMMGLDGVSVPDILTGVLVGAVIVIAGFVLELYLGWLYLFGFCEVGQTEVLSKSLIRGGSHSVQNQV